MTKKHSVASKARWVKISSEERKKRMSLLAKMRWAKIGKKERRNIALKMVEARKK